MAKEMPEPESTTTGGGGGRGGPALPRRSKNPITYAKGPAPDSNADGGSSTGKGSTDTGVQTPEKAGGLELPHTSNNPEGGRVLPRMPKNPAGGPELPRKKAGGSSS
ncbi:hypothetical protein OOK31_17890 [Streptomyces sp. NBC_00249]|uniref:hypothetical protein n=1 Tax=Streptomyces sp. NBC_00249 TaxID=2975690 RepID=UPI002251498F|nr:hypothetical protein [Streptomyces sp. NBC_00249]MCX5195747.1 hypothetical protein [Streptomyces sp. NBC_00249]